MSKEENLISLLKQMQTKVNELERKVNDQKVRIYRLENFRKKFNQQKIQFPNGE